MKLSKVLRRILCFLLGGACFWTPTTVIQVLTRRDLNLVVATLVPLAALLSVYFGLRRSIRLKNTALWMLAGTYILGPIFIMTAWIPLHGGFYVPLTGWKDFAYLALLCLVPPFTLVLAGYDSTMFGMLAITVVMIVINRKLETVDAGGRALRQTSSSGFRNQP